MLAQTRAWVAHAVVGLNLCPFAKAPWAKGQIRYVLCEAVEPSGLAETLAAELRALATADPATTETTLLVHPHVLGDFVDYNDFLDIADAVVAELGLDGVLQVASFHPDYRFADTDPDDIGNASNRSPYPTLHLLREESIDRAVQAFPDPDAVVDANLRTLEALGPAGWAALQARCRRDARLPE